MNTTNATPQDQRPDESAHAPNGNGNGQSPHWRNQLERASDRLAAVAPTEQITLTHVLMRYGEGRAQVYSASIGATSTGLQPSLEEAVSGTELLYRTRRALAQRLWRPKSDAGGLAAKTVLP